MSSAKHAARHNAIGSRTIILSLPSPLLSPAVVFPRNQRNKAFETRRHYSEVARCFYDQLHVAPAYHRQSRPFVSWPPFLLIADRWITQRFSSRARGCRVDSKSSEGLARSPHFSTGPSLRGRPTGARGYTG